MLAPHGQNLVIMELQLLLNQYFPFQNDNKSRGLFRCQLMESHLLKEMQDKKLYNLKKKTLKCNEKICKENVCFS